MRRLAMVVLILGMGAQFAHAEEGMWTFDHFPGDAVKRAYDFEASQVWLDHAQRAGMRLSSGCSASFVSGQGLVQTNHHCAQACIQQLSSPGQDYIANGYLARRPEEEIKCPAMEVDQLLAITDVTGRITRMTAGRSDEAFADAMRREKAALTKDCAGDDSGLRCDVVDLYQGGVFALYKYRRFQDVRLVFAPEMAIAFFGGDSDNFEYPRYDLDVTFLRVYADNKPFDSSATYFPYAREAPSEGDLVFTIGSPGRTDRQDTVAELLYQRDVAIPRFLIYGSELRGVLSEFSTRGREQARIANGLLFGVENALKARKGQYRALLDSAIIADHIKAETELRRRVENDPQMLRPFGGNVVVQYQVFDDPDPQSRAQRNSPWLQIDRAIQVFRPKSDRYIFTEGGYGLRSDLLFFARDLVRHATEKSKPNAERLSEFTDANFPDLRQHLLSSSTIYPELEKLTLAFSLAKLREALGPDDPFVRTALAGKSPRQLAEELVEGSHLGDLDRRRALLDADPATLGASDDAMIAFAIRTDPELREIRKDFEDHLDAPLQRAHAMIARAVFRTAGTSTYPDATFTPRISYGQIKGYQQAGNWVPPMTRFAGAFARATGAPPFALPASWLAARPVLDMQTPFDIATTNDIIGGNSGSPLVNRKGEVVGLVFDGNIQSLGGDFGYDIAQNRAVAVSTAALREALDKVYHADRIVAELEH